MRRSLFVLIALLAAAPASASAHHNDVADARGSSCDRPDPQAAGFLTVTNPNDVPLHVSVDGRDFGKVGAGDTIRVGPVDLGRHTVAAKFVCTKRHLNRQVFKQRVWVDSTRYPERVRVPYLDLGIVAIDNEWIERMDVAIDGRVRHGVPAEGHLALIAPTGSEITLLEPRGHDEAMTFRVHGRGLQTDGYALVPPSRATVLVSNPTREYLQLLCSKGRVLAELAPYATQAVRLKAGWNGLVVRYRGRTIDETKLIASPFHRVRWDVSPRVALYDYDDGRGRHEHTVSWSTSSDGSSCDRRTSRSRSRTSSRQTVTWRSRWGYSW